MNQESKSLQEHQIDIERLHHKNQLLPRIRQEFLTSEFNFNEYIIEHGIEIEFGIDVLAQMALHKRCTLPTLVGILNHHYNDTQKTTNEILRCAVADLIDWSPELKLFIVKFTISDDVQEELDKFQFPLPLVVEPKEIKRNIHTGYHLVSTGSVILKNNHHNKDVCLDHLNRVNKIKFKINHDVVSMVKNQWKNLDKPKDGESREDFNRRKKAFEKYDNTVKEVINKVTELSEDFYFAHAYDKRGRVYCRGYHINYQGHEWAKANILFSEAEITI